MCVESPKDSAIDQMPGKEANSLLPAYVTDHGPRIEQSRRDIKMHHLELRIGNKQREQFRQECARPPLESGWLVEGGPEDIRAADRPSRAAAAVGPQAPT